MMAKFRPHSFVQTRLLQRFQTVALVMGCALALALPTASPVGAQDQAPRPAPDTGAKGLSIGAFSDEQARRGQVTYAARCTSCHAASTYTGPSFARAWVERTVFDLYDLIRTRMPDDNPGSLSAREYVDVVAYIFSLNGYPLGKHELEPDDELLRRIRIDAPPAKP